MNIIKSLIMSHHKVTNNNDIPKFDDLYFNVWKHQLSFIMKTKTFMTIVDGLKKKLVASAITSIQPLPFIGKGSFVEWEDRNALTLFVIIDYLDNTMVFHIQSCQNSHEAWEESNASCMKQKMSLECI